MTKRERYLARGLAITVVTTVLISMIGNDQSVAKPLIAAAVGAIVTLLVQPKTGLGAAGVGGFSAICAVFLNLSIGFVWSWSFASSHAATVAPSVDRKSVV